MVVGTFVPYSAYGKEKRLVGGVWGGRGEGRGDESTAQDGGYVGL